MSPSSPSVSVVMPVRNGEDTLASALASMGRQTGVDWELVVVDDGSTDRTAEILSRAARRDCRVRVLSCPARGLVPALQTGWQASRGALIARMDADDLAHPRRLSLQKALLDQRPDLGAVGSRVHPFASGGVTQGWRLYVDWINRHCSARQVQRALFVESPLAHPSTMIRRRALEAVGGYRDFDGPEDYDLWLRLASQRWGLAKVPQFLLAWRDHQRRLTRQDPRYRSAAFLQLKAQYLAGEGPWAQGICQRPIWIWGAGRLGRQWCRCLAAQGVTVDAFVDVDPKKIGRKKLERSVLAPEALLARPEVLVLTAVAVPGVRALIRARLKEYGRQEGEDFFCCA